MPLIKLQNSERAEYRFACIFIVCGGVDSQRCMLYYLSWIVLIGLKY